MRRASHGGAGFDKIPEGLEPPPSDLEPNAEFGPMNMWTPRLPPVSFDIQTFGVACLRLGLLRQLKDDRTWAKISSLIQSSAALTFALNACPLVQKSGACKDADPFRVDSQHRHLLYEGMADMKIVQAWNVALSRRFHNICFGMRLCTLPVVILFVRHEA